MGGNRLTIRVAAAETGGRCSVVDFEVAPGFVAPPIRHRHHDMDWHAVVTDGELAFDLDGEERRVRTGGVVYVPRGTAFRWWNASRDHAARWMITYVPGGFEQYFVELVAAVRALGRVPTPPEMGALAAPLWKKHGVEVLS